MKVRRSGPGRLLLILFSVLIACVLSTAASGQGRGRGRGLDRKPDIFVNGHDARAGRLDGRGPNLSRKCGRFVNCHDARNGRLDGRGPGIGRGAFHNGIFVPRRPRVRHRSNRSFDRDEFVRRERFNRLEMLREERIAERRRFGNRADWRRP